jgi:glycosyltransferase involved in cell wall biosynthesis
MLAEVAQMQGEFDFIHFHCSTAWLPAAANLRTPSVFTIHTFPTRMMNGCFAAGPRLQSTALATARCARWSLKLGREFPTVYNGCDFDAYEPRYEPGHYLAFLGRFSEAKNPLGAIRIAQACNLPIVLAGQPQNAAEQQYFDKEIKPLIDGRDVAGSVRPTFPRKSCYSAMRQPCFFQSNGKSRFGLVMIEAMACGTPVVAQPARFGKRSG